MVDMKDVEGLNKILSLSDWVETVTDAWFYTETILLMARFHQSVQPAHAFAGEFLFPALVTGSDEVVYVVPLDYLSWSETLSEMLTGPMAAVTTITESSSSLWIKGQASETVTVAFSILGWSLKTGISLDPSPQPDGQL